MGSRPERVDGHIGTETRPRLLRDTMDESLMERRRVNEEGRKVVKFFFEGRISVAGNGSMMT